MADLNIGNSSASVLVSAKHNGSVIPQINNTYDLGTSTLKWKNIYGSLKGNADSATKLATERTISLTGSVTGSGTFDGSGNLSISTTTNHSHNSLSYKPILNSESAINSFHAANTLQAAVWTDTSFPGVGNGIILDMGYTSAIYGAQIAIDDDPTYFMALRQKNGNGWNAWKRIPMGDGTGASGTWGISISGNAATATKVVGSYTANGGKQQPNYFGTNRVGFLMMNTTVNNNSDYKDWIIMDCYSGSDVGGGVALGVNRQKLGAYIMRSAAERTSWAESAELLHTSNYTSYTVKKDGTGASGTWGISVSGNAATATKLNISEFTTDTIDNVTHSGLLYGTVGSYTGPGFSSSDAMILSMSWNSSNNYGAQIALDDTTTPNMYVRNKGSGSWSSWSKVLLSTNYTDYTVKKDGTGASGTWGISVTGSSASCTGNAATATKLVTARTIRTNLASTSAVSFDGSTNITPGVTGTLPITNGGTGATTASSARDNLGAQSKVLYGSSAPSDSTGSNGDMYIALESGDFKKDIVDLIYPVGSIYISMNSTNPSTLFGGTWEAFGQGRVLIGAGTGNDGNTSLSFPAGFTGGEYKHYLTKSEIPGHTHSFSGTTSANSRGHTHSYTKATGVQGHKLTEAEMPAHTHAVPVPGYYAALSTPNTGFGAFAVVNPPISKKDGYSTGSIGGNGSHNHGLSTSSATSGSESQNHTHTFSGTTNQNTGGGASHNNIQPYIGVYMWKRTA